MAGMPPPNIVVDLGSTYGPTLIAIIIASTFYGMTFTQTLVYFNTYSKDPWHYKGLVIVLGILNTLHEVRPQPFASEVWNTLIPKYGDLAGLAFVSPHFAYQGTVTSFVAFFAQSFYTYRIYRFSNNWIFPVILIPLIIGLLVSFLLYTISAFRNTAVAFLSAPYMANLTFAVFVLETVVDMLIAIIMCTLLYRNRTSFYASHRMILRLMNASVSTGTCTAVFSVWASISLRVWPMALYYPLGIIPLCPLYVNAVLANLNSRNYMKNSKGVVMSYPDRPGTSIQLSQFGSYGSRVTGANSHGGSTEVVQDKSVVNFDSGDKISVHVESTRMSSV